MYVVYALPQNLPCLAKDFHEFCRLSDKLNTAFPPTPFIIFADFHLSSLVEGKMKTQLLQMVLAFCALAQESLLTKRRLCFIVFAQFYLKNF